LVFGFSEIGNKERELTGHLKVMILIRILSREVVKNRGTGALITHIIFVIAVLFISWFSGIVEAYPTRKRKSSQRRDVLPLLSGTMGLKRSQLH